MYRRKRRIIKTIVLGLVVAAFAAPAALGEPRGPGNPDQQIVGASQVSSPDDRSLYRGSSPQLVSPDDRALSRAVESPNAPVSIAVSPDDRSLFRGVEVPNAPLTIAISPDDRGLFRGVETPGVPVNITVSSPSDEFQWTDAGLGAASTLVFVLLLGAGMLVIRNQRRRLAY